MVFEQIFRASWLERRPRYAFLIGIFYSLVGIGSASIIFGSNPGLMAVAFTAILILPSLNRLLSDEENVEIRENKFSLIQLFRDHRDIFEIYLFITLGIFVAFGAFSIIVGPEFSLKLFEPQLALAGITGRALGFGDFWGIIVNNLLVFAVCFILSLVYGAGAAIFITWNASVWGAIFGYVSREAIVVQGQSPWSFILTVFIPLIPHLVTETLSYLSAAIAGGVLSKASLREKLFSREFNHIVTDALIILAMGFLLVIIAGIFEVSFF